MIIRNSELLAGTMDKSTMGSGKPLTLILVNILAARCLKIFTNSYLFLWLYSEFGIVFLGIVKIGIVNIGIAKIGIAKIGIVKIGIVILGISKIRIKCY